MNDFPLLRASLAPEYASLPAYELERVVQSVYGGAANAEAVEGLFDDIGSALKSGAQGVARFAQQAAPVVARALPSIAQGAATGATVGGPWGALIGAAAGAAGGIMSQSRNNTVRNIGGAIHTAGNLVSTVRGGGANGALGSLGSIASGALGRTAGGRAMAGAFSNNGSLASGYAGALVGMLTRPEMQQAIQASLLGQFGRQNVPVGQQQVPVHQMLAALAQLAQRTAHEVAEFDEHVQQTPAFAEAAAETFGLDADDAEGRTDALLTLLALTPSLWMSRPPQPVNVTVTQPSDFGGGEYFWLETAEDDEDWGEDIEEFPEAWDEYEEDWDSDESDYEEEPSYA